MDLQELISRGRYLFFQAPGRLDVFKLVNGRLSGEEIASELNRHQNSVRRDLRTLLDAGLIQEKLDKNGIPSTRGKFSIYEKLPLAKTVSLKHFESTSKRPDRAVRPSSIGRSKQLSGKIKKGKARSTEYVPIPDSDDILDVCRNGEDQIYEFKSQATEIRKITKEIAAMANASSGGLVLYGVEDDGTIEGSDKAFQSFDQSIQNSVHSAIKPSLQIKLYKRNVLGNDVFIVAVPKWNGTNVYQYENRVHIRKGTNVFAVSPEELKQLHDGRAVI